MSGEHENGAPTEAARSRIKVVMNAKHETQWEVSVVAGETQDELDRIRGIAVAQHRALVAEFLGVQR